MSTKFFNNKRLIWAGLVGAVLGAALGAIFIRVASLPQASTPFQKFRRVYPVIGAVGGAVCSVGLAMVFFLDKAADEEEEQEERSLQDKDDSQS